MRKKQNHFARLRFRIMGLFLIGIAFGSCEVEEEIISNSKKYNNEISFEQFKRETGLSNFKTKIGINFSINNSMARTANGDYELSDFNISTEIIKRLEYLSITSYTFRIFPNEIISTEENSIFNLTLYKKGEIWETLIIEFKLTPANYLAIENGITEKVEGEAKIIYQGDYENNTFITNNDAMRCVSVVVITTHCNGRGNCASGTCDGCSQCVSYETTYMCSGGGGSNSGLPPVNPPISGPIIAVGGGGYAPIDWIPVDVEAPTPILEDPMLPNVRSVDDDFENQQNLPCEDLKNKDLDTVFNGKMIELKGKAATQDFESAYVTYQNPASGNIFSNEFTGTADKKEATISFADGLNHAYSDVTTILHNHLDDGSTYKVFSFSDIIALGEIANYSTRPSTEYAIYVTTSSGTFALKVNNKILLKSKLGYMKLMEKPFETEFVKTVKKTQDVETQKLKFLQFIKNMPGIGNPGLDLYQKNEVTGIWNKLSLSSNGNNIQENPCN